MKLRSTAFEHEADIPRKYTCQGADVSPPLSWSDVPPNAQSLALIIDDPDAPDPAAPKTVWTHWVLYDIPPDTSSLEEGLVELPLGTRSGKNDWGNTTYGGPCPPIGKHRYFHRLYALDKVLGDLGPMTKHELEKAMQGHVLARAELMGTYQKK